MLLYITGGVGFLLSVFSILLIIIFHKKDKSKIVPLIIYFLGFVLFMGSGFLHWKGFELDLPFFNSEPDSPLDLTGEWKQTNSGSDDAYQGIYISDNTIEVYWVTENGDTTALYWAGSFTPPTDSPKEYTWESENDTSRTGTALMASGDATKEFTYKNGKLSYSASAFGVTTTIEAEKGEWGYQSGTSSSSQNNYNIIDDSGDAELTETSSSTEDDRSEAQEAFKALLGDASVLFYENVRNDVTGRWRLLVFSSAETIVNHAIEYYDSYFSSDDEVHIAVNLGLQTTSVITVGPGCLLVDVHEYVDKEEHDAKILGSGMLLKSYIIDLTSGEIEDVSVSA